MLLFGGTCNYSLFYSLMLLKYVVVLVVFVSQLNLFFYFIFIFLIYNFQFPAFSALDLQTREIKMDLPLVGDWECNK